VAAVVHHPFNLSLILDYALRQLHIRRDASRRKVTLRVGHFFDSAQKTHFAGTGDGSGPSKSV
jgi:hypothetical protein